MTDDGSLSTVLYFKDQAEKFFQKGDVEKSFSNYLVCLRLYPEWKLDMKETFVLVLCAYGELLEERKQFDKLFSCYEDALEIYYDSEEILCNLGAHLCRLGFHKKAYYYFLEAVRQNEKYLPAHRNLQNVANILIERWHFRMLNDSFRNGIYREAILKKVQQNFDTVLDIGTGTGLLSIYAAQHGAKKIFACDYSKEMISIANEIILENMIGDKITLINKLSNDIEIPTDIPSRVSLVITETMDSGLLGEDLLKTLSHAWEHLLLPPYRIKEAEPIQNDGKHGIVIPFGGTMFIAGIESHCIAKKYYYPLVDAFTDDCMEALQCVSLAKNQTKSNKINNISTTTIQLRADVNEPYDTERLQETPYRWLTNTYQLFSINFNDPQDINDHLIGDKCRSTFVMTCTDVGYIHAIAAWFKVQIDENTTLCSSPNDVNGKDCCWDQVIFPLNEPVKVDHGSLLTVEGSWQDGKICLNVTNVFPNSLDPAARNTLENVLKVPQNVVCMLNDFSLIHYLNGVVTDFVVNFNTSKESLYILDLYPLPIFGLNILRNGHLLGLQENKVKLVSVVESEEVKKCIHLYALDNSINLKNIQLISQSAFDSLCSEGKPIFDVIVTNLIESNGDLNDSSVIQTSVFREMLKEGGVFFPEEIKICCQLVHSKWLEKVSRVQEDEMDHLHISSVINQYQVPQHLELNLLNMRYTPLSDIFECASIKSTELNGQIENEVTVRAIGNEFLTAVCYWFDISFIPGRYYSTLTDHAYVHQAAFLNNKETRVTVEQKVNIKFLYQRGMFRISMETDDINEM